MPSRLIPCLLLSAGRLVKTIQFKNPMYVGDPINAVRVFNDKEVDELIVLDIDSSRNGTPIAYDLLGDLASEAFMPLCYGGGVRAMTEIERLFSLGIEKVAINTASIDRPGLITQASEVFGSQSVVGALDVGRTRFGRERVVVGGGRRRTDRDPVDHARALVAAGAGELVVTSIDREGTREGYDLPLVRKVVSAVDVPVVAVGGAGNMSHVSAVWAEGAAGAGAGTMFVTHGSRRGVLISYPSPKERGF